jgi:hypothetical protein
MIVFGLLNGNGDAIEAAVAVAASGKAASGLERYKGASERRVFIRELEA